MIVRLEAPRYGGYILHEIRADGVETDRDHCVQTDWDVPSLAQSLGWSLTQVQPELAGIAGRHCDHWGTDGTVTCPHCHLTVTDFIDAAADWLSDRDETNQTLGDDYAEAYFPSEGSDHA